MPVFSAADRLACLRLMMAFYEVLKTHTRSPRAAFLLVAVSWGHYEHRPLDISSLAELLGWSRPTTFRRLHELEDEGLVELRMEGHRCIPTPLDNNGAAALLDGLVAEWRKRLPSVQIEHKRH